MTTYSDIADTTLVALNQIGNYTLKQTLIVEIKEAFALLLRRDSERNNGSDIYMTTITVELAPIQANDLCNIAGLDGLRSIEQLPEPVRLHGRAPFISVSTRNRKGAFIHTPVEVLCHTKHNKYTQNFIRYDYVNGYLYVYNNCKIRYAHIKAPFIDVEDVCKANDCLDQHAFVGIPADMVFLIKDMLLKKFSTSTQNTEIEVDETTND